MRYSQFRSGLTWDAIRVELQAEQAAAKERGDYMYVTRATVLGRWRQHKLALWEHVPEDEKEDEYEGAAEGAE